MGISGIGLRGTGGVLGAASALLIAALTESYAVGTWSFAGTNPDATNQPTSGKPLWAMQGWNGKLYSGFGDWTANTGPIELNEFNPTNHTFTPRLSVSTEAIQNFRIVNGRLLIPWIDPKSGESNGGMGVGDTGRSWKQLNNLQMVHCFDVVTYTGTDLWLVGSGNATTNGPEGAKAYRSFDNGATWTDVKSDNAGGGYWDRFYWLGVLKGKLYIQNSESAPSSSLVFDGATWTNGPNISDYAMHAEVYLGKLLLTTSYPRAGNLMLFDGATVTNTGIYVYDYTIAGSRLYALRYSGGYHAYSTTNLVDWTDLGLLPSSPSPRSIGVVAGKLFAGMSDGTIYEYSDPVPYDDSPPSVGILAPVNNKVFPTPVNVTINASASNIEGTIAKVEFFNGVAKLGEDTTAPYDYTWSSVPTGVYNLAVVATDLSGRQSTSAVTVITVSNMAPALTTQPKSVTVIDGATASFQVAASGSTPFAYRWWRNGAPLAGATATTYSITANLTNDNGAAFSVVVTNAYGSITSATAVLTVHAPYFDCSWVTNADGNWSSATNWRGGYVPNGAGVMAWLTNNITAARTVTVDTIGLTLGQLNIGDSASTYYAFNLIPGSNETLTFDNGGDPAELNQRPNAAAQFIGVPILFSNVLAIGNASGNALTISNGVTGSGTLVLHADSSGGITLSTLPVNHAGSIVNTGTGTAVALVGRVGTNVTRIDQTSGTSPLTVSNLTVAGAGTTLANDNASGTAVLTVSGGVTGTGDLVLSNNSAINTGITLSALAVNPTGAVINRGAGPGSTLISAAIASNVTALIQASAASPLVINGVIGLGGDVTVNTGLMALGGASTYTGRTMIADGGLLVVSNATGSATGAGAVNINSNGTLRGKGRIYGPVALNAGGSLSPGVAGMPGGTLTVSNLTWYGGGIFNCEVTSILNGVPGAGVDYGLLTINKALTAVTNGQPLIIRLDTLGQDLSPEFQTNANYALKLMTYGSNVLLNAAAIQLDTNAFLVGGAWTVTNRNNALYVVYRGQANQNAWMGSGASTNWSVAANWSLGHVPWPGEDVIFDWSSLANCQADVVTNGLGSLTLADSYTGTVTFVTNAVQGGMSLTVSNDVTINAGNLVFCGDSTAIGAGSATQKFGVGYTVVASNLTIAWGASLNVDDKGFPAQQGPGAVPAGDRLFTSASYGGQSGGGSNYVGLKRAPTYGSAAGPTALGSGGSALPPCSGGGAIKLVVSGTTTVEGRLSANAVVKNNATNSAASGGSIWIVGGALQGSGTIEANGGTAGAGSSGGGGRIDISQTTNNFWGTFQARGGTNAIGPGRGQSGSILLPVSAGEAATLSTPSAMNLVFGSSLTFPGAVWVDNGEVLTLEANEGNNVFTFDSLTINTGGTVRCRGNLPAVNAAAGGAISNLYGAGVTIVASNLTIQVGGSLDANGQGYFSGPGAAGGYGGVAWNGTGQTYGAVSAPSALGSGSGTNQGGGALRVIVYGTLTVKGTNACNAGGNGASGGSLWIECGTLQGTGQITVNGGGLGASLTPGGNGGAGGRLHIVYSTNTFTGQMTAYGGGTNATSRGAAGTVLMVDRTSSETNGTLMVRNSGSATNNVATLLPGSTLNFIGTPPALSLDRVIIRDSGVLALPADKTLAVTTVWSNRASFLAGTNSTVALVGTNDARIYGNTLYENLCISNEALKVVRFEAGKTNAINRRFAVNRASLLSLSTGQWWFVTLNPATGTADVTHVKVQDSSATNGSAVKVHGAGSRDLGHNVSWQFPGPDPSLLLLR